MTGISWYDQLRFIPWGFLDPSYAAVVQGTEEAALNALVANEDMTGALGTAPPLCRAIAWPSWWPPGRASALSPAAPGARDGRVPASAAS
jgi:hypothetical protein